VATIPVDVSNFPQYLRTNAVTVPEHLPVHPIYPN